MKLNDWMERLRTVEQALPFGMEETDAARELFVRWHYARADSDLRLLEIWLYCYTQRYVLKKLARDRVKAVSDVDRLVERVYTRARDGMEEIEAPERFTHWVNVVCHHEYINARRSGQRWHTLDDHDRVEETTTTEAEVDQFLVRRTVRRAVGRLPEALRRIAELRLLEGHSYHYIAAATQRPAPTVRTYTAKAIARLREDPELRQLLRSYEETMLPLPDERPPPHSTSV